MPYTSKVRRPRPSRRGPPCCPVYRVRHPCIEAVKTGGGVADGLPVRVYFHGSLMDNFESQKGYAMQFGLIPSATPNPSFAYLGSYTAKN